MYFWQLSVECRCALSVGIAMPLVLTSFFYVFGAEEFQNFRGAMTKENFGKLWRTDRMKYFLYSVAGAFAVVGYGINVVWISHKYVFQTWCHNFIAFISRVGCLNEFRMHSDAC